MRMLNDVMSRNRARDVTLMLGLFSRQKNDKHQAVAENGDVAKLFFDSFSKRVGTVEDRLKIMSSEIEKLKISVDRSQLSDLVLLERLQKAETLVRESLNWIKQAVEISGQTEKVRATKDKPSIGASKLSAGPVSVNAEQPGLCPPVLAPVPQFGR